MRQLEEEAMSMAKAMQPLLEASTSTKRTTGQQDIPNGVHNPLSVRRRCAEDDPVNVRVAMVNSATKNNVISELEAVDTNNSVSQNST